MIAPVLPVRTQAWGYTRIFNRTGDVFGQREKIADCKEQVARLLVVEFHIERLERRALLKVVELGGRTLARRALLS